MCKIPQSSMFEDNRCHCTYKIPSRIPSLDSQVVHGLILPIRSVSCSVGIQWGWSHITSCWLEMIRNKAKMFLGVKCVNFYYKIILFAHVNENSFCVHIWNTQSYFLRKINW